MTTPISADEARRQERTADIDYIGLATMEDWFDDVAEVFEKHGCTIEGSSDGPTTDSWYERLVRSEAEVERLSQWKQEATLVIEEWEAVHAALGKPGHLGESKAAASRHEVERLSAAPCPHVIQGDEGTAYCALAEATVERLSEENERLRGRDALAQNLIGVLRLRLIHHDDWAGSKDYTLYQEYRASIAALLSDEEGE